MKYLQRSDRIFVAGHKGLVGSAIAANLAKRGYGQILTADRASLDLCNQSAVAAFFERERPDVVFVAAAKVGGIRANNEYRADFIFENLAIQNNLIWSAHKTNVRRLVFLGSSCIYPKNAPQPMVESALLTGELEYTNRPYAIAKIAGMELVDSLRKQYKRDYFSVMPTNLYGPRDNFHPDNSHVLPALVRRIYEAKVLGSKDVVIWGTGTPRREFLYSEDCADAIVHLAEHLVPGFFESDENPVAGFSHINIGCGEDVTIRELAETIGEAVGFSGKLIFDHSKPDGTPRKLLDVSLLRRLGWKARISLPEGIRLTLDWYLSSSSEVRT